MDFELNQSSTDCGNGVNRVRTVGDLLIEYRIEQGGATATLKVREWNGSAWGAAQDLTAVGAATGTINSSAIPTADSDIGAFSARTFGEMSLDLDFVFDPNTCESFGSAFLKSRASDSFTSQMKDFIKPVPVNITNCGKVIIRKVTDPASDPATTTFGYTKSFGTDPSSANTFSLGHGQSKTFTNVLFGSSYTVTEDMLPTGWDFLSLDCSASTGVTPAISSVTVTFTIDNAADILDCTYTNRARGTIIVKKISEVAGSFDFTSGTLPSASFTLTTTGAGETGSASQTFSNLTPGTYDVSETVPTGWNLDSATCTSGTPAAISLAAGQTVTCTFTDSRERGAILITKTRKHAADGSGDQPHPDVMFTITGGSLPSGGTTVTTNAQGKACLDGLVLSSFAGIGNYTVTETPPAGYAAVGATSANVIVTTESTCGDENEATVSFSNMPLTDVTVSVNSQVPGGTSSTISCVKGMTPVGSVGPNDDVTLTLNNRQPETLVCTIMIDP